MRDSAKEEIKKQAADKNQKQYVEPVSSFTAGDAEERLEGLHEMYSRFMRLAVKDGFSIEYVDEIGVSYDELREFLQQIIKNARAFDVLKASKE